MDQYGSVEMRWTKGYNGGRIDFITDDVICFKCGNCISFISSHSGVEQKVYRNQGDGIALLAVHPNNKQFAIAEMGIKPKITVLQYPSFSAVSKIKGSAQLEYLFIEFSSTEHLLTFSGCPEYELIIWEYSHSTHLCSVKLSNTIPITILFNPFNWKQISICTSKDLTIWSIEVISGGKAFMKQLYRVYPLPSLESVQSDEQETPDDSPHHISPDKLSLISRRAAITLPRSSRAGLTLEAARRYEEFVTDKVPRLTAVTQCWISNSPPDILVGCAGGHLLKIDGATFAVMILIKPGDPMRQEAAALLAPSRNLAASFADGQIRDPPQKRHSTSVHRRRFSSFKRPEGGILGALLHSPAPWVTPTLSTMSIPKVAVRRDTVLETDITIPPPPTQLPSSMIKSLAQYTRELEHAAGLGRTTDKSGGRGGSHQQRGSVMAHKGNDDVTSRWNNMQATKRKMGTKRKDLNAHIEETEGRSESGMDLSEQVPKVIISAEIGPGSMDCLKLNKDTNHLFAGGSDGFLRRIAIHHSAFSLTPIGGHESSGGGVATLETGVAEKVQIGYPITYLTFSPMFKIMAIGSSKGTVAVVEPSNLEQLTTIFAISHGRFISIAPLAVQRDYAVTLRDWGLVQIWLIKTGSVHGSLRIASRACCLATSPIVDIAVVGLADGSFQVLDLIDIKQPRVIHSVLLHRGPINCITFTRSGTSIITGSNDGYLFVVDGRATENFIPLGYTTMPGVVVESFTVAGSGGQGRVVALGRSAAALYEGATKVLAFTLPIDLNINNVSSKYSSSNVCELKDDAINKMNCRLLDSVSNLALTDDNLLFAVSQSNKNIMIMPLPTEFSASNAPRQVTRGASNTRQATDPETEYLLSSSKGFKAVSTPRRSQGLADKRRPGGLGGGGASFSSSATTEDKLDDRHGHIISTFELMKLRRTSMAHGQQPSTGGHPRNAVGVAIKDKADMIINVDYEEPGHQLPGGIVRVSQHRKWIASGGADGRLIFRALENIKSTMSVVAHNFWHGGVQDFAFMTDGRHILTTSNDDTLRCYHWKLSLRGEEALSEWMASEPPGVGSGVGVSVSNENNAVKSMQNWQAEQPEYSDEISRNDENVEAAIREAIESDEIYAPPPPKLPPNSTWLEIKRFEAENGAETATLTLKMRKELREIRRTIQSMLAENEQLTDVEKLARREFDLDLEEHKVIQKKFEQDLAKLREEKEAQNTVKYKKAELMKVECWDGMAVKGRGLVPFESGLEVYNYPLSARTKEELNILQVIRKRRVIEMADYIARSELKSKANPTETVDLLLTNLGTPSTILEDKEQLAKLEELRATLTGSLTDLLSDAKMDLFYSQFELCSREQKIDQIVIIQDTVRHLREKYNRAFDEMYQRKESEIAKIAERNARIRAILVDLKSTSENVVDLMMNDVEKPEMLFVTTDDEVKAEKFMTAARREAKMEEERLEEERRQRDRKNNWRERGLMNMMGGVLEKSREDELEKDIPVPAFMRDKPEPMEWSFDETKMAAEYHLKVNELEEERQKYKQKMESEIKKLKQSTQDAITQFDIALQKFTFQKINSELAIYLEEMKVVRLRYSLLVDEELSNRKLELEDEIDAQKKLIYDKSLEIEELKVTIDQLQVDHEEILTKDKDLEKTFLYDFRFVESTLLDKLHKLYRQRPRLAQRGPPAANDQSEAPETGNAEGGGGSILNAHARGLHHGGGGGSRGGRGGGSGVVGGRRASTASRAAVTTISSEEGRQTLEEIMAELNNARNMPSGCDKTLWDKLCKYRRDKIESETSMKQQLHTLHSMQDFMQRRIDEETAMKNQLQDLINATAKLRESQTRFMMNSEIQLLLREGQIEVEAGPFIRDLTNSFLINRSVVEKLNRRITKLGETTISNMLECKEFKKGIIQLEWEHKRMAMEVMDLKNKMKDIDGMKINREVQADYDLRRKQQLAAMDDYMKQIQNIHDGCMKKKQKELDELKATINHLISSNKALAAKLVDLNVMLNDRKHVAADLVKKTVDAPHHERYDKMLERCAAVNLEKSRAVEIGLLHAEVTRLRQRTFAFLEQFKH